MTAIPAATAIDKRFSTAGFGAALTYSALFVLCYWPTYFIPAIPSAVMQKSYFFIMLGYLALVVLASRTPLYVPHLAYIFLLPLLAMLTTFFFSVPQFSFFHISVLIKPFLLFLFSCSFYSLLRHNCRHHSSSLLRVLEIILLLQLLLVALQIVFGDVAWLKVISFRQVYEGLTFRAPGSFDWVYITCYFLTFFLAVYLSELFSGQHKVKAFLYVLLILLVIFLAQSKTGYATTVLVMLYFVFLSIVLRLNITRRLLLIMLLAAGLLFSAMALLGIRPEYIFNFIELLQSGQLDASTSTRKAQTLIALEQGLSYWYRGSPAALDGVIIENTYLDYLFRYGVIGAFISLAMMLILYFYSFVLLYYVRVQFVRQQASLALFQLALGCHVSMFSVFFYALSGTPLDAYRSAVWSSFLVALLAWLHYGLRQNSSVVTAMPQK